ncbi:MAG: SIS domain-containing protein [Candidatus Dormibacteria bacterium]
MNGELMAAEMAEQPRVLAGLVARADELRAVVGRVGPRQLTGVTLVARGSSACAALFGRYVLEVATGRPVSEAAPSLHTLYNTRVDYSGQLVVAMSQSGETPEIVAVTERLAAAGASTIAITNGVDSPLAQVATGVYALDAGIERSVPATKTVTAELLALALLASALGLVGFAAGDVQALPDTVESLLSDTGGSADLARSLRHAESLLVVARGYLLPAALELALKLEETCRLAVVAYSAAELRHGHIASIGPGTPALVMSVPGPAAADVASLRAELAALGALTYRVDESDEAAMRLPAGTPEVLSVVPAVIRAQQLALALALSRGYDPDAPTGLSKVTLT